MTAPRLSILIPTLRARRESFKKLHEALETQRRKLPDDAVEFLIEEDEGQARIGAKRNRLLDRARGQFVVFVDDDDMVADDYLSRIVNAIDANPETDCIAIQGEIRFRGRHPRRMVHTIAYQDWEQSQGRYVRPPCHITPIRRSVATRFRFLEIDYSEDIEWTLRMAREGALKHEVAIEQPLYFYASRRAYIWQWLLDRTQPIRHALGLRMTSRLRRAERAAS